MIQSTTAYPHSEYQHSNNRMESRQKAALNAGHCFLSPFGFQWLHCIEQSDIRPKIVSSRTDLTLCEQIWWCLLQRKWERFDVLCRTLWFTLLIVFGRYNWTWIRGRCCNIGTSTFRAGKPTFRERRRADNGRSRSILFGCSTSRHQTGSDQVLSILWMFCVFRHAKTNEQCSTGVLASAFQVKALLWLPVVFSPWFELYYATNAKHNRNAGLSIHFTVICEKPVTGVILLAKV